MMFQRCRTPDLITHSVQTVAHGLKRTLEVAELAKCILDSPAASLWWYQGERKHNHIVATLYSLLHKFSVHDVWRSRPQKLTKEQSYGERLAEHATPKMLAKIDEERASLAQLDTCRTSTQTHLTPLNRV